MQAVRFLFCVVCAVGMGSGFSAGRDDVATSLPVGHIIRSIHFVLVSLSSQARFSPRGGERSRVLNIARAELGVKELTGKNDGVRVEQYLRYTGLPKGNAWCASFVSWVFGRAGFAQPRTAWSPALFPKDRVVGSSLAKAISPRGGESSREYRYDCQGLVFGIYFPELKRIAHVGLVEMDRGNYIQTIEGNTASDGGRDGNAVHRRLRLKKTISKYADWL